MWNGGFLGEWLAPFELFCRIGSQIITLNLIFWFNFCWLPFNLDYVSSSFRLLCYPRCKTWAPHPPPFLSFCSVVRFPTVHHFLCPSFVRFKNAHRPTLDCHDDDDEDDDDENSFQIFSVVTNAHFNLVPVLCFGICNYRKSTFPNKKTPFHPWKPGEHEKFFFFLSFFPHLHSSDFQGNNFSLFGSTAFFF